MASNVATIHTVPNISRDRPLTEGENLRVHYKGFRKIFS